VHPGFHPATPACESVAQAHCLWAWLITNLSRDLCQLACFLVRKSTAHTRGDMRGGFVSASVCVARCATGRDCLGGAWKP
jgi:hypothetical protein